MKDGFKILNLKAEDILNNPLLKFNSLKLSDKDETGEPTGEPTGEIIKQTAIYNSLIFTHRNETVKLKNGKKIHIINTKLSGSLHKYFNSGLHNYNDFFISNLLSVIIDLWEKFRINPLTNEMNNLEFGVNIITPYSYDEIKRSIINHKGKPYREFDIDGAKGIEFKHSDYIIKIYAKGIQYNRELNLNLPVNLIRYEIKVIRMEFFKRKGIRLNFLSDCLTTDLNALGDILLSTWSEILFTDTSINTRQLKQHEKLIYANGNNPNYWQNLKPLAINFLNGNKDTTYKQQRKKYYRELNKFKSLLTKYSTATIQQDISKLITEKWKELIFIDSETEDKITNFINSISVKKRDKITDLKYSEKGHNNNSCIVSVCPILSIKTCKYCGKDISQTRKNRVFCDNNNKCKNDYNNPLLNPKNNFKRMYEKRMQEPPGLFNTNEYIILTEYQKQLQSKHNSIYNKT
jgi:hypothetical protein